MQRKFSAKQSITTPEAVFVTGTYDENDVSNTMNAAWGIQSDHGEITIQLAKHKTTNNLEETGGLMVAFATESTVVVSDHFGIESGNKMNKTGKAGCHVRKDAHVDAPVIGKYPVVLECLRVQGKKLRR